MLTNIRKLHICPITVTNYRSVLSTTANCRSSIPTALKCRSYLLCLTNCRLFKEKSEHWYELYETNCHSTLYKWCTYSCYRN